MSFSLNKMDGDKQKIKILMLDKNDNRLAGHAMNTYLSLPDCYDKRIVVMQTLYDDMSVALLNKKNFFKKIFFFMWRIWRRIYYTFKYGAIKYNDKENKLRMFYGDEYIPFSAKWILSKHPNFIPDIISIHWTSGFINSDIIRELHERTNALIAFIGLDEAHLTAGCHYPVDCEGFKTDCSDCPIFIKGKEIPRNQYQKKIEVLRNIPFVVLGVPYFCRKASTSSALKYAQAFISSVKIPMVTAFPQKDARKFFNIPENAFVVMFSAARLNEIRKGFIYTRDAIRKISEEVPNLVVLMPGRKAEDLIIDNVTNIAIKTPGYLNQENLFMAFCASDCFLSTTIADTGPMMVNFSIALGVPVVSFNIGVAQDLVIHKKTGYIANYMDSDDVAAGILYLSQLSELEKKGIKDNCNNVLQTWIKRKTSLEQLADYYLKQPTIKRQKFYFYED